MGTIFPTVDYRPRPAPRFPHIPAVTGLLESLSTWIDRARERHALQRLNHDMLKDIGLSPADVDYEAGKPFWRP